MQHPTQRGELLCNSVGYTVASFQDILSWLCNSSGLGHSCLLWNWHALISRKSVGHCWPPRLCPNFKIKEKVQSWNSNLRYRREVGPKRNFLLDAFYWGSLCIVVVLFLRLFVFLSWYHSDQMSERSQVSKVTLCVQVLRDATPPKKRDFLGIFPKGGGEGLLNSQNFCKLTKLFLVCQNHS